MTGMRPALPTILLGSKGYFIDLKARLFRETLDPGRYIDFDSVEGERLCRQAGVVTCLRCGASVIVSVSIWGEELRCVRCGPRGTQAWEPSNRRAFQDRQAPGRQRP